MSKGLSGFSIASTWRHGVLLVRDLFLALLGPVQTSAEVSAILGCCAMWVSQGPSPIGDLYLSPLGPVFSWLLGPGWSKSENEALPYNFGGWLVSGSL